MIIKKISLFILSVVLCNLTIRSQHNNKYKEIKNTSNEGMWLTKGDGSTLLKREKDNLSFIRTTTLNNIISIDSDHKFQTVDGFGFTLTGGSAYHIYKLNKEKRTELLNELFGNGMHSIGISYLRISIGASDLDANVFSYDDLNVGNNDPGLIHFSIKPDSAFLIPLLKEILAINPNIKILGSPWSPPVWMKSNHDSKGGILLKEYYQTYALYFVKYIQQMKFNGIPIDAITPQNEPLHPGNNPSMYMSAREQADFIKNYLGPAFKKYNIQTKIIVYDHNCNKPEYPLEILNDKDAKKIVDGSAFHLYEGDINVLSKVHDMHPDKNIYFTEQWTGSKGEFKGDLLWHMKNVIIGSMKNWSKIALEWNLANDAAFKPHTPGGCTECKGALTIDGSISRNVSYYIIAHASKFIPPGSFRIQSNTVEGFENVAFLTPDGRKVLIVLNESKSDKNFAVKYSGKYGVSYIPAESVMTYVW